MNRPIRRLDLAGLIVIATCLSGVSTASAQDRLHAVPATPPADTDTPAPGSTVPGVSRLFRDVVGDFRRLSSDDSLRWLTFGATLAGASRPFDDTVTRRVSGAPTPAAPFVPGRILGGSAFQFGASFATYSVGRVTGNARIADVGGRVLRAQLLAHAVTGAVKISAGRTRPDGSTLSFPSGHTSISFASATVLHREFGWKVGVPAYAVASYVGLSRIEHRKHYLSDVVFGAAIGLVAGRSVTVGRGDGRFVVTPVAAPGGGGLSFVWVGR